MNRSTNHSAGGNVRTFWCSYLHSNGPYIFTRRGTGYIFIPGVYHSLVRARTILSIHLNTSNGSYIAQADVSGGILGVSPPPPPPPIAHRPYSGPSIVPAALYIYSACGIARHIWE